MLEDGGNRIDSILANVGMAMLETGSSSGQEGFDELGLTELAQESQRIPANILVGVLEVISDTVATERSEYWS